MTQVANLTASLTVQAKTSAASGKEQEQQAQTVIEQFASIMNQSAQNSLGSDLSFQKRSSDMTDSIFQVNDTAAGAQKDYEKLNQTTSSRKITEAKQQTVEPSAYEEKVSELADDVKEVVQETMQVSEEELETAMETLGLTALDLLDPKNLTQLAAELTGSDDVSALLTSESFQMVMQETAGLIEAFQQDNGLDAAAFTDLLAELTNQAETLTEALPEELMPMEEQPGAQMYDALADEIVPQQAAAEDVPEQTLTQPRNLQQTANPAQTDEARPQAQAPAEEQSAVPAVQNETEQSGETADGETDAATEDESGEQTLAESLKEQTGDVAENAHVFQQAVVTETAQAVPAEQLTPQVQSYIDVESLMNQMEGLARTFTSAEGTTLEMQLNPESLGRLYLTVTEKQGMVTAQIAASNEQVKEALQTQMIELQETLQAQGLKVEAVEVTVATHEFEQNLDGNTSANGQMQEEARQQAESRQGARRNLNINSLDELSGLMSEEELLVAQMMRDNGGTVDFTA